MMKGGQNEGSQAQNATRNIKEKEQTQALPPVTQSAEDYQPQLQRERTDTASNTSKQEKHAGEQQERASLLQLGLLRCRNCRLQQLRGGGVALVDGEVQRRLSALVAQSERCAVVEECVCHGGVALGTSLMQSTRS